MNIYKDNGIWCTKGVNELDNLAYFVYVDEILKTHRLDIGDLNVSKQNTFIKNKIISDRYYNKAKKIIRKEKIDKIKKIIINN